MSRIDYPIYDEILEMVNSSPCSPQEMMEMCSRVPELSTEQSEYLFLLIYHHYRTSRESEAFSDLPYDGIVTDAKPRDKKSGTRSGARPGTRPGTKLMKTVEYEHRLLPTRLRQIIAKFTSVCLEGIIN
jgi:hypothetical protein